VVDVVKTMAETRQNDFAFSGIKQGRFLSDIGTRQLVHDLHLGITRHGLRSTFRDWAAETTSFQHHVVEMAVAHTIDDKVEAAYRRGDRFEKRRRLMET
jgi:integrase